MLGVILTLSTLKDSQWCSKIPIQPHQQYLLKILSIEKNVFEKCEGNFTPFQKVNRGGDRKCPRAALKRLQTICGRTDWERKQSAMLADLIFGQNDPVKLVLSSFQRKGKYANVVFIIFFFLLPSVCTWSLYGWFLKSRCYVKIDMQIYA